LIADHVALGKKCTVACIEVPLAEATAFGVMDIDAERNIVRFLEKPAQPPHMPGKPDTALASMINTPNPLLEINDRYLSSR
jgi:glucose-1-phosphate adenylyltransferase